MKLAFSIGSYRLIDFVKLGINQIQRLCPDAAILVSDDPAHESEKIKAMCDQYGVLYKGARARRGHFSADYQCFVNSLVFGEATGADVAIKISQRLILRLPEAISVIQNTFSDPNIMMATPGQPKIIYGNRSQKSFGSFTTLSDIVMVRVGAVSAKDVLNMYRERLIREKVPWASFIECTIDELHQGPLKGKTIKLEQFTNPSKNPIYLRRYQASERQYRDLALSHGWNGQFPLAEWGALEAGNYLCRPRIV